MSIIRSMVLLLVAAALSACGGGGGSTASSYSPPPPPPPPPPAQNQSPGGIWTTQYTVTSGPNTGDTIKGIALVSENGNFYFASRNQNNGCAGLGFGQASVTGNVITGNVDSAIAVYASNPAVNTNCTYPDGTKSGTGTISGTVTQQSSMTLTATGTTSAGLALPSQTTTWTFSNAYNDGSSLATIAGNYTDGPDTLTISSNGQIFEQDPTTNCVINGLVSLINPKYAVYSVSITITSCTGADAAANGVTLTGLAALVQTVTPPAQLAFGLSANVNGQTVVFVDQVSKQ